MAAEGKKMEVVRVAARSISEVWWPGLPGLEKRQEVSMASGSGLDLWHLTITSCVSRNPLWSQFLHAVTTEKRRPHVLSGTPVLAFCMAMWFKRERERESRAAVSWALAVSGTTVRRAPSIRGSGSSEASEGVASECQWHLSHPDYQTVTRLA